MIFWVIQTGEPILHVDGNVRAFRYTQIATRLAQDGHEVIRWSSTFEHLSKALRFSESVTIQVPPRQTLRFLHAGPTYHRNVSFRRVLHQRCLARMFRDEAPEWPRPDLLFVGVPVLELAEVAVNYGQARRIPVIVDIQDEWPDVYLSAFPAFAKSLARSLLHFEYERARKTFRRATGLTAVSDTYLQWGLRHARRSRRRSDEVFPLGFTPPSGSGDTLSPERARSLRGQLRIPEDKLIAVFLGSFGCSYDIEAILLAAAQLERLQARVHIVMAGTGDKLNSARALGRHISTISIPGWLDHPTAWDLSRLADIGLCAYSPHALQSIPYKAIEYLAAGLPIISSLSGELQVLLQATRCGLFYEAGNPKKLAEQIQTLANDRLKRRAMGERAHKLFLSRFNAELLNKLFAGHIERVQADPEGYSDAA